MFHDAYEELSSVARGLNAGGYFLMAAAAVALVLFAALWFVHPLLLRARTAR
jgi:tellurite resistance protein TehA-like permease